MTAREGILFLVRLHQSSGQAMTAEDWEQAFKIAASSGSSASMKAAQRYYSLKHSDSLAVLAFGKGVWWLSILRQEEGEQAFKEACEQLLTLAGLRPAPASQFKGQWQLGSGEQVFDRADSHVATHPTVHSLLGEALSRIHSEGRGSIVEEVDFGRVVGESICVETRKGDEIVFARRPRRAGLTRFVKNRQAEPTSRVSVVLFRLPNGNYELITAYVGALAEPEPWDDDATQKSLEFWLWHALCWGYEETVGGTETKICPW